jgi:hypothetical protein
MKLRPAMEAERQALLRALDSGESGCPDCRTISVRVTRMTDLERWHVAVEHNPSCVVRRRARSQRAYARWLADQLAALGLTACYCSTSDMDLTHA